ncbi:hypothetical protein [Austwickia chelonae]|uniref:hypothetical protein n=1 Tax=Austwickia chelonae TaxID=100225 RepID=UPI0002E817F7|nr:hypothetical protein [Austwickia chelonae]
MTTSSGAVVAELVQQAIRHAFEEIRSAGVRVEDLTQEVDRARRLLESAMTRVHWRSAAGEGCRREAEEIQRDLSRVVDECAQAVEFLRSFEARHGR